MEVEVITYEADGDRGGFGSRVHALIQMLAQFADVRVVRTDWFEGPRVPGVDYVDFPVQDGLLSKLRRLSTYYKTDFPVWKPPSVPDLTIVESLDLLGLLPYEDKVPFILDEHNVYWELLEYEMVNSPLFKTWLGKRDWVRELLLPRLLARAKAYEVQALQRAGYVLVPSEPDREKILEELPHLNSRIGVIPNCIDLARVPVEPSPPESQEVVFVANYNYVPNREAARAIIDRLAPDLPEARFLLVGGNAPRWDGTPSNVEWTGYVRDLRPVLRNAAVCVAPLSQGSGTRLKILTYLGAGRPVVATPKACEGLAVEDGVHLLVREIGAPFREAVRELLEHEDLRRSLGRAGRRLVEKRYDWRVYVERLRRIVETLAGGPGSTSDRPTA